MQLNPSLPASPSAEQVVVRPDEPCYLKAGGSWELSAYLRLEIVKQDGVTYLKVTTNPLGPRCEYDRTDHIRLTDMAADLILPTVYLLKYPVGQSRLTDLEIATVVSVDPKAPTVTIELHESIVSFPA